MKKLKSGFTLAEVLITLGIIGVVAAIILPSVMSNYQYKSVGVKLAKFMSTVEGAARPYTINNDNFSAREVSATDADGKTEKRTDTNVDSFVNEAFIFKTFDPEVSVDGKTKILRYPALEVAESNFNGTYALQEGTVKNPSAILKDGTSIQVFLDDESYDGDHKEIVPVEKFGAPVFRINFDPKVQGLPSSAHKNFNFTVTELGYVFPHENDDCTWMLYNNNFTTTSADFEQGKACHTGTTSK